MIGKSSVRLAAFIACLCLLGMSGCSSSQDDAQTDSTAAATPSTQRTSAGEGDAVAARAETWAEKMQVAKTRCMQEAGWDVTLTSDFSIEGKKIPEDQQSSYMEDSSGCEAEYTSKFPPPEIDEKFARKQYADNLKTVECLKKQGYPPTREPISEQAFVDELVGEGITSWRAYEVVPNDPAIFAEMEKACPQPGSM